MADPVLVASRCKIDLKQMQEAFFSADHQGDYASLTEKIQKKVEEMKPLLSSFEDKKDVEEVEQLMNKVTVLCDSGRQASLVQILKELEELESSCLIEEPKISPEQMKRELEVINSSIKHFSSESVEGIRKRMERLEIVAGSLQIDARKNPSPPEKLAVNLWIGDFLSIPSPSIAEPEKPCCLSTVKEHMGSGEIRQRLPSDSIELLS